MRRYFIYLVVFIALLPATARPQALSPLIAVKTQAALRLPLDCRPGADCWVLYYPDFNGRDPACGARTYAGSKGTDIALRDGAAMEKGTGVLAAADGTVVRVRDGEDDRWADAAQRLAIRKAHKECGNAVLVDHGDGLQTVYCHLKKNSIAVKPGQAVRAGARIGDVGLSGDTAFPSLYFGVMRDGAAIDPLSGAGLTESCGTKKDSLWAKSVTMPYEPLSLYAAGFRADKPDMAMIERAAGTPISIPAASEALVFWVAAFGLAQGDRIVLEIVAPDGRLFARRDLTQDKSLARQMYYVGKDHERLIPGLYHGQAHVTRDGKDFSLRRDIRVE